MFVPVRHPTDKNDAPPGSMLPMKIGKRCLIQHLVLEAEIIWKLWGRLDLKKTLFLQKSGNVMCHAFEMFERSLGLTNRMVKVIRIVVTFNLIMAGWMWW
jgi:hypothetical protein